MLKQSTILTRDFLINKCNYDLKLKTHEEENIFLDYYLKTCEYINNNHFTRPSIELIEAAIKGSYIPADKLNCIVCSISDAELRKHLFLMAMAKQLIYDFENGRTTMQRTDQTFSVCPEFRSCLSMLGFVQSGMFSRLGR